MFRRVSIVSLFLIGAIMAPLAQAVGIATYGPGLKSCRTYLDARQQASVDQVAFVDWLSGYFSGVNKTSTHRNNFFGLADLKGAMSWLDDYCNVRPQQHFAEAVGIMLLSAKPGPAAHSIEPINYGSADKSCGVYLDSREQRDAIYLDASAEFTNWLGGYLSGLNAMSLDTNDILGKTELSDAVAWLERYCRSHSLTSFGDAVGALVQAQQPRYAAKPNNTGFN